MSKNRTFCGRKFAVQTLTILTSQLSNSKEYQQRLHDDPVRRGTTLANELRDKHIPKFTDRIIVVPSKRVDDRYDIVEGFGRQVAAGLLGWTHIEVDVLISPTKEELAFISLTANLNKSIETPNTTEEKERIAYELHEAGYSIDEIAEWIGYSVTTAQKYLDKGKFISEQLAAPAEFRIQPFESNAEAREFLADQISKALDITPALTFQAVTKLLQDKYAVHLGVYSASEKHAQAAAYQRLVHENQGREYGYAHFMYVTTSNTHKRFTGIDNVFNTYRKHPAWQDRFYGGQLENKKNKFNTGSFLDFVAYCERTLKRGVKTEARKRKAVTV